MTTLDKAGVEAAWLKGGEALKEHAPEIGPIARAAIVQVVVAEALPAYLSTLPPVPADVAETVKGLTDLGAWLDVDFGSDEPAGNFARSAASLLTRVAAARDAAMATLKYCERCWSEERGTMIDKMQAAEARATAAEAALAEATAYAERLACALHARHYAESAPEWEPLSGDLIGLLTQIDNMTCGLAPSQHEGEKE